MKKTKLLSAILVLVFAFFLVSVSVSAEGTLPNPNLSKIMAEFTNGIGAGDDALIDEFSLYNYRCF